MKKFRFICILAVAVATVLSAVLFFPVLSSASDSCGVGLEWSLDPETGVLTVSGQGAITAAPWSEDHELITEVVIGEGVTELCDGALFRATNLKTVRLPSTLKKIGYQAFEDCDAIEAVHVTDLDAFATITYSEVQPGYFEGNPLYGGADLYLNGEIVRRVELSEDVTVVSPYAFYGAVGITEVILHDGVTTVGKAAFYGCDHLRRVTLGESVVRIDESAFGMTRNLMEIYNLSTLPVTAGTDKLGEIALYAVAVNTSRETPSILSVTEDGFAFAQYGGKTYLVGYDGENTAVTLPDAYKGVSYTVRAYAFWRERHLTSVTIPDTVDMIENNAFLDADSLRGFTVPDGVSVGDGVIVSGKNLRSATLPYHYNLGLSERLWKLTLTRQTELLEDEFEACPNLLSLTIPETVTHIDIIYGLSSAGRLLEIYNLTDIHISVAPGAGLPAATAAKTIHSSLDEPSAIIEEDGFLFFDASQCYVRYQGQLISTSTYSTRREADYLLVGYTGESPTPTVPSEINGDATARVIIREEALKGLPLTAITLSERIIGINERAFEDCASLASIALPDTLEYIAVDAFRKCPEDLYTIENGLYYVGDYFIRVDDDTRDIIIKDGTKGIADGTTSIVSDARKYERIHIPSSVRFIGASAFWGASNLREVTISEGVALIEERAFAGSGKLTSVTLPSSVTEMGNGIVENCAALRTVVWNTPVSEVPGRTFSGCTALTSITLPDTVTAIGGAAFRDCASLTTAPIPDGVTAIGGNAFAGCTALTAVHLSEHLEDLDPTAFSGCTGLESLTVNKDNPVYHSRDNCIIHTEDKILMVVSKNSVIPTDGSVTSFASNVFAGMTLPVLTIPAEVTSITLASFRDATIDALLVEEGHPNYESRGNCLILKGTGQLILGCRGSVIPTDGSVTVIAANAFAYATPPSSVTIPASVTRIGSKAFSNAEELTALIIEATETPLTIQTGAFFNTSITELSFTRPTVIYGQCFGSSTQLTKVWLHADVEFIPEETLLGTINNPFSGIDKITEVSFADMDALFEYVGWFATSTEKTLCIRGEAITDLVIPAGMTTLPRFTGATVRSISIPASVTEIKSDAFRNCYYLESIYFGATDCTVGKSAFESCGIKGDGITVTFGDAVTEIPASIFDSYAYPAKVIKVILPEELLSIGERAFFGSSALPEIDFPESLLSIGHGAFAYTGITSVTLGDNLSHLGTGVFLMCASLTEAHFPDHLSEIPESTFFGCKSLESFTLPTSCEVIGDTAFSSCLALSSVTLSENIRVIGSSAFNLCPALTSLTLPDTVTEIGEEAFAQGNLMTLRIPAGVTILGKNILRSTDLSLLTVESPTVYAAMLVGSMSDFAHVGGILVPATLTGEGDSLAPFPTVEDYTEGGVAYKLYVNHVHAWGDGHDIENPSVACEKDWSCSVCRIHRILIIHTRGADATCTDDCLCTVCNTVLATRLGHDAVHHDGKAPTCTEGGWAAYETCNRCTHSTYESLGALGHDTVYHDYKAPSCTAIGWEAYETCGRCTHTTYVEIAIVPHDIHFAAGKPASCTEDGWWDYEYCTTCTYTTHKIFPAYGHSIGNYHEEQAPTCTADGWHGYYTCAFASCSASFTGTTEDTEITDLALWKATDGRIPAVAHTPVLQGGWDATCVSVGCHAYYVCMACAGHFTDETCENAIEDIAAWKTGEGLIPMISHSPTLMTGEVPTCEREGHKDYYLCATCAFSYADEACTSRIEDFYAWTQGEGKLSMISHTPTVYAGRAATCVHSGVADCYRCSGCWGFFADPACEEKIENYSLWANSDGLIPVTAHSPALREGLAPTCTADGYKDAYLCPTCDGYFEDEAAARPITDFGNWTRTDGLLEKIAHTPALQGGLAPTCTESGYADYYFCTTCTHYFADASCLREISTPEAWIHGEGYRAPMGHTSAEAVEENRTDATCTDYGSFDSVVYCATCHTELSRSNTPIPPVEHDYADEWTVDTPPSCNADGMSSRHCQNCSACTEETPIPATGHSFGEWITVQPETCSTHGKAERICSSCLEVEEKTIDPHGHTPVDGGYLEYVDPTCEGDGIAVTSVICNECGTQLDTRTELLPATGHTPSAEWIVKIPATCTGEGLQHRVCLTCGREYDPISIPPVPHSFTQYVPNRDATCEADGTKTAKCDTCDTHETLPDEGSALGHDWADATHDTPKTCRRCRATEGQPLPLPEDTTTPPEDTTTPPEDVGGDSTESPTDTPTGDTQPSGCGATVSLTGWILLLPLAAWVVRRKRERIS